MDIDALVAAYARGADRVGGPPIDQASVRDAVTIAIERVSTTWPIVEATALGFAEAIGASVADDGDPRAAIGSLHVADLWLAVGCAEGDHLAIAALDRVLVTLRPTLARMGAESAAIDDLLQQLRARLLASTPDHPARIRGYRGRGELRSWLKVALVRDATRTLQRDRERAPTDELDRLMDPGADPELAAMKDTYRSAFRVAFAAALAELGARDRNVLRYHLVEDLSIDEIGALFRVHRSTAARWLVSIREGLFEATRSSLMRQLALGPADVDSVLRMIRSRLDASLATGLTLPEGHGLTSG